MNKITPTKDFKLDGREYKAGTRYRVAQFVYDHAESNGFLSKVGKEAPVNKALKPQTEKKEGLLSKVKDAIQG